MKDVPKGRGKGMNVSGTVHLAVQVASVVQARLRSVNVTIVVSDARMMVAEMIVAAMTVVVTTGVAMIVAATTVDVTIVAVTLVVSHCVNVKGTEVGNVGGTTGMAAGNADAGVWASFRFLL